MRLNAQDRRQHLLDAAAELFSRRGYEGTTTRQIADAAGVTEALIFRHFPNKEDLYWEIIEDRCRTRGAKERLQERLGSGDSDEAVFSAIAADILGRHTRDPQLFRLLLFSALEQHELSHRFFRTHISEYYEQLADRIRERIRQGKFRRVDPLLAARSFIGMLMHYFLIQELFGGKLYRNLDIDLVSSTMTEVWMAGMNVPAAPANGTKNGHKHKSNGVDHLALASSKSRPKRTRILS